MAPYICVPLPVHFDTTNYVKVILPVDALRVLEEEKTQWFWWPEKHDAFPAGFREGIDNEADYSLRVRSGIHGEIVMDSSGIWDLRGTNNPDISGALAGMRIQV